MSSKKDPKSKAIKKNKSLAQKQKQSEDEEKSQPASKVGQHSDPKCKVYVEDLLN